MRTRSSVKMLVASFGGQLINLILLFVSRRLFVHYFAEEYLGVNGLFSNILTVLSLAELGIGTAMAYSLYKPAADGDKAAICRFMNLYRLLYQIVGGIVLLLGVLLLPFLQYLVRGDGVPHLRLIYGMYLFDTVAGYFLSYKQAMLAAHQEAWKTTVVTQTVRSVQILLQMAVIVCLRNFYLYLAIQMCSQLTANIILSWIVNRRFPYLPGNQEGYPEKPVCMDLFRQVGALSMHRLGSVMVSHTDNMILSAFQGLVVVGIYSNYQMVLNSVRLTMSYVYNAFSPAVGNLAASGDQERVWEIHRALNFLMSVLYGWIALCLAVLFNPFIQLFFGDKFVLPFPVTLLIVLDFYIHGMRQMTLRFRDVMGLYWYDRYKPVVETLLNLTISVALVGRFGIAGVVAGTIASSLLTNFWVEPLVFFRYGIQKGWKSKFARYYLRYAMHVGVLLLDGFILWRIYRPIWHYFLWVLWGILTTALYALTVFLVFHRSSEWKYLWDKGKGVWAAVKHRLLNSGD